MQSLLIYIFLELFTCDFILFLNFGVNTDGFEETVNYMTTLFSKCFFHCCWLITDASCGVK